MPPPTSSFLRRRAARWAGLIAGLTLAAARLGGGPTGGEVVAGDASIATAGANTTVQAGNNSILRWNSFDLASHESVTFLQPGADARVLNWIGSLTPSQINGTISANGQVYLLNPAGVYFGATAVVDVGGLYTAAGSLSKEDFLAGLNRFTGLNGDVRNAGSIRGDFISLVGRSVENTGTIVSPGGFIALAAGEQVFLGQNGSQVYVEATRTTALPADVTTGVRNAGTLDAGRGSLVLAAGDLYAVAIAHEGKLLAADARLQGQGSGLVRVDGAIDTTSASGPGGRIEVTGEHVRLGSLATLDASGATRGGTVLVGGDFQGKNADVRNASTTVVATGATLRADATQRGDGGRVIIWADLATRYGGSIQARGGATGGNGGFAEVSGKGLLQFRGTADLTAAIGRVGTLLLDPTTITIQSSGRDIDGNGTSGGATDDIDDAGDLDDASTDFAGASSIITGGAVVSLVNSADLTLAATQDINVNTAMSWSGGHVLTLEAGRDVNVASGATLTASGAGGGMAMEAGRHINIGADLTASGNGGSIALDAATNLNLNATLTATNSGSINLSAGGGMSQLAGEVVTTNTLTLAGTSNIGASAADRFDTQVATLVLNKTGGDVFIAENTALNLEGSTTGSVDITTNGAVLDSNPLTVGGTFTLNANSGASDITFDEATNNFATIAFTGDSISVRDAGAIVLGTTDAAASLFVRTGGGGSITGTSEISVGTSTTLNTSGDISLTHASNDFGPSFSLSTTPANLTLVTDQFFELPGTSVGATDNGTVNITAAGMRQLDQLRAGAVTLSAGSGNIQFSDGQNEFDSITILSGANASVHSDRTLTVGGIDITGNLTLDVDGNQNLGQTAPILVDGTFTLSFSGASGNTDVNLGTHANDIAGAFTFGGNTARLRDFVWFNGNANASTPTLSSLTNLGTLLINQPNEPVYLSGAISTTGAQYYQAAVVLTADTSLTAPSPGIFFSGGVDGAHALAISNAATTEFGGALGSGTPINGLTITGGGATVLNGGISSTGSVLISGALTLNTDLSISTTNDSITLSSTVDSEASETNNLTLLSGTAAASLGGGIGTGTNGELGTLTVTNSSGSALALPAIEAATLNVTTSGNITDSGNLAISGTATFATGTSDSITLNNANTFGTVVVTSANDVTLVDTGSLALGGITANGTLGLTFGGNLTQTALLDIGGGLSLTATATADVNLSTHANLIDGAIAFAGTTSNINDVLLRSDSASGSGPALSGLSNLGNLLLNFPNRSTAISGTITPSGFATFSGPVTLSGATSLTAGGVITFSSTINGGQTLALNGTGTIVLGGAIGGSTPLTSLTTSDPTRLGGSVTTTGIQSYTGAVQIDADATLHTTNSAITFSSTLDSQSGEKNDLTIETGSAAPSFGGGIGTLAGGEFGTLEITNTAVAGLALPSIEADALNLITFGPVTDTGTLTIAGAAVFDAGIGNDITLDSPGNTFGSVAFTHANDVVVGDTGALVLGTSFISGNLAVTFGGALTQSGILTVVGTTVLTATSALTDIDLSTSDNDFQNTMTVVNGGNVRDFALRSLNNNANGFAPLASGFTSLRNLNYDFPNSPISINGNVTSSGALTYGGPIEVLADAILSATSITFGSTLNGAFNLTLNTAGATVFGGVVGGVTPLTSLTTNAGGTTSIGANITTTGAQTFGDAVTLTGNATLVSTGGAPIDFDSTLNGAFALTVTTSGLTTFGGAIGGTSALTSLTANGGGITEISGNITTTGAQLYSDTALLTGNATLTSTASGNIGFGSTLNGAQTLVINTAGVTSFAGLVGGSTALSSLTTDSAGSTTLATSVLTSGGQAYNDAVNLTGAVVLSSSSAGAVTLGSTVNGAQTLEVSTAGTTTFNGLVGGTTPLMNLTTYLGGTTVLNANVTTAGFQDYVDAVTVGADITLTSTSGGVLYFESTVNGAHSLVLDSSGDTRFFGIVGGGTALTSLTTQGGGTTYLGTAITTTGGQSYVDAVSLVGTTTLTSSASGPISFSATVNGAQALTVNTAGTTTFNASVGGTSALASLTTDSAGGTSLGGNVSATGAITFNDAVTLAASATIQSSLGSAVTFGSTLNGPHALLVNTIGSTVFGGAVGGTTALTSLATNAVGTTSLAGNVTTTGAQTYNDAVTLTGGATLTSTGAGNIGFGSTVNGAQALTVNTTGTTTFLGAVGGATALTSLTTNAGGGTQLGASVTTTGAQTFNDAVTLTAATTLTSSSAGNIDFGSTIDGATTLAVNTNGATNFGGTVGGGTALTSLTTNAGGTTTLAGNVTTTGGQTFSDAVTLGGATSTLTSSGAGNIGFGSTLNGAADLAVNTTGTTSFGGVVGGSTPLTSITTNAGGVTTIAGNVSTTGAQTYHDAVQFLAATTLASSGAGAITFNSTLNGAAVVNVNTGGATTFGGAIGGTTALTSLATDSAGTTSIAGNVTTSGAQSFSDAVTLTGNSTLTSTGGGAMTFGGTVNGAFALDVVSSGLTTFGGAVGGTTALSSLISEGGGTTSIAGNISTTGLLQFFDAVTLAGTATLTSSAGSIDFESTLNGAQALTLNSGAFTILAGGAGSSTALTSLTTNAGGTTYVGGNVTTSGGQTFNDAVLLSGSATFTSTGSGALAFNSTLNSSVSGSFAFAANTAGATTFASGIGGSTAFASIATDSAGTTQLGGTIGAVGPVAFGDAVTLTSATTVTSSGGSAVTFGSTINGGQTLAVNTTGATTFSGVIGGTTALTSLTTNAGGTTSLGGNVTTTGAQTYNDAVTLAADATLASTGSGAITLASTLNGARNLVVNTAGTTAFGGAVGGTSALTSLTTDAAGTTTLAGSVTTTGAQTFGDAVALGGAATLTSSGAGNIGFGSTVNGAAALVINTAGATSFGAAIGGTTALTSLTTNTGGTTALGGNVTTTGAQTYNDAVTLGGATATLTSSGAGNIGFGSTVNGAADLAVNTTGTTSFGGVVGGTTALTSLTTNAGGTTTIAGNITTTGAQTFNDAVQFLAATTLASSGAGAISFNSTVDGAAAVTVNTAGFTTFGGTVGGSTALTSLTTNAGGTTRLGGNVTTTGLQSFGDAVLLLGNTSLTSTGGGGLTFGSTLNGAFSLTANTTGVTIFGGVVGGSTALASLTTNAGGSTSLAGDVTTTGAQTYGDIVQLTGDTTLRTTNATVTLAGGLDSAVGQANDLTILTGTGATTFGGTVGGGTGGALGAVVITTTSAVTLAATTADTLDVSAGGNVTDTGALVISGDVNITASGASVVLDSAGNSFGTLTLNAGNITIVESGAMTLGTVDATGALTLTAGGTLTGASEINVGGLTTLSAGGAISLTNASNTFTGAVLFGGAPTSLALVDDTPLDMGALTVGGGAGTLTLTAPGLTQSGAIVAGVTSLNAGTSTINFTNAGNSFGALTLSGGTVAVTESGALQLTSATAGDLTLTSVGGAVDIDLATLTGALVVNAGLGANLGAINAASASVIAGGAITDDGNLAVTGLASFNSGAAAITLGDTTTANFGSLALVGGAVSVRESSALQLTSATAASLALSTTTGAIDVDSASVTGLATITSAAGANLGAVSAGSLQVTSAGAVTDDGDVTITGAATINAGANAITLGDTTNANFGSLALTGGTVNVREGSAMNVTSATATILTLATTAGGIDLDAATVTGALTLNPAAGAILGAVNAATLAITTSGDVTDDGAVAITGATTIAAGTGAIVLDSATNSFGDLTLSGASAAITENGPITDGSAWSITGTTTLNAGSNAITLDALTSATGALGLTGGTVAVTRTGALALGAVNVTTLSLTSPGGISGTDAILAGATTLNAGTGAIALTNSGNVFGDLTVAGGIVTIHEGAPMTDGGAWTTTGLTTLNAGTNSITLDNPANVLGELVLIGGVVSVRENDAITDGGDWATGEVMLNAGANPITLDAAGSTTGALNLTGGAVSVSRTGLIELGVVNSSSLALASPAGFSSAVAIVTGAASFNAGSGIISFTNAGNVFGDLTLVGGAVTIVENDAITDGGAWTTTGVTTLNAGGNAITLDNAGNVLGPLVINSGSVTITENDAITQGAAWITGATALNAGANNITLADTGNRLGNLTFHGAAVQVVENEGIALAGSNAATSLVLTAAGAITDAPGTTLTVAGVATLEAGSNAITLGENAGDTTNFGSLVVAGGAVSISEDSAMAIRGTAGGAMTLAAAGVELGGVSAASLAVTSTGPITDTAATVVAGAAVFTAPGQAITLDEAANDFSSVQLTGGAITVRDVNALAVNGVNASGNVALTAATNLTQVADIAATGAGSVDLRATAGSITTSAGAGTTTAGGTIRYEAGTNAVLGGLASAGGTVTVKAGGAAQFLSALNLSGVLDVTAGTAGIEFLQTLNGTGTTSDLTFRTTGTTRFGAAVGNSSGPDSITTDAGGTTVIAGGTFVVSGALALGDDVTLIGDTTIGAASATVTGPIRSQTDGGSALTLNVGGDATFTGPLGAAGARLGSVTTSAGGRTILNGGAVMTTGAQSFGDAVVLGAATTFTASTLTFAGALDSAATSGSSGPAPAAGPADVIANVGGATVFAGAVGQGSRLGAVTTDAGGTTAIRGNFNAASANFADAVAFDGAAATRVDTTGALKFASDVTLSTDLALRSSTGDLTLGKGASGAGRGLTLEAPTGTISVAAALGGSSSRFREIAASGRNVSVHDVWTTGNLALANGRGAGTPGGQRNDYVEITGSHLNSETGDVILGSGATTTDTADDKTAAPLRSSIFKSNDGDLFIVGKNVTIQPFERMAVRNGMLVMFADETLTVSSAAAAHTLALIGNQIRLRSRPAQQFEYGTPSTLIDDRGTDLVSGAVLFFQPTGLPGVPARANLGTYDFANSTGTIRTDNPGNVVQVIGTNTVFVADLRDNLLRPLAPGIAYLDLSTAPGLTEANMVTIPPDRFGPLNDTPLIALVAQGAQVRNSLEQAFTPIVPREEVSVPETDPNVSDAVREQLFVLGIYARKLELSESIARGRRAGLFVEVPKRVRPREREYMVVDARMEDRAVRAVISKARAAGLIGEGQAEFERVKQALGATYERFVATGVDGADGRLFRGWLERANDEDSAAVLHLVRSIEATIRQIELLGLTRQELEISKGQIYGSILRGRLDADADFLRALIEGEGSAQTAEAPSPIIDGKVAASVIAPPESTRFAASLPAATPNFRVP